MGYSNRAVKCVQIEQYLILSFWDAFGPEYLKSESLMEPRKRFMQSMKLINFEALDIQSLSAVIAHY